jgi:hypothetical protein
MYLSIYGGEEPRYARILEGAGRLVIEQIANSDALYNNTNYTILVTLVGEAIMRGRLLTRPVEPADWVHAASNLKRHRAAAGQGLLTRPNSGSDLT